MLVLSRKQNQKVIIGGGARRAELLIIDIREDKVRLGIDAPSDVPVHRSEIYDRLLAAGTAGSLTADHDLGNIDRGRPAVISARDSHLLLRFADNAAMQAAIARGRVSFSTTEVA